jgi:hypothetical protein
VLGRQERCGASLTAFWYFLPLQPSAAFRGLLFGCASKIQDAFVVITKSLHRHQRKRLLPRKRMSFLKSFLRGWL